MLYKIITCVVITFLPLLHTASILGQPDIFGLFFAFIIVLLTMDYDFLNRDYSRWIVLFASTISLALTRRWYVYFIVSYYIVYFVVLLLKTLLFGKKGSKKPVIINVVIFGVCSAVLGIILIKDFIMYIISSNFGDSYSAWNRGGFWFEFLNQSEFLGFIITAIVLVGWIYGVISKKFRQTSIVMICTYVISIFLFTRIQNMGYHQSLLLLITYVYGIFMSVCLLYHTRHKILSVIPAVLILLSFINCSVFNYSDNFLDSAFSKLSVYPVQRTDLNGIADVVNKLNGVVKTDDSVTFLSASDDYDSAVFMNYPDINCNNYIVQNNYYAASSGFPENFFTSKYVVLVTPIQERQQVKNDAVLSTLVDEFTNNEKISSKFTQLYNIEITNKISAKIYERTESVDNGEVDVFINDFKDYCEKYPSTFYDRLVKYKD